MKYIAPALLGLFLVGLIAVATATLPGHAGTTVEALATGAMRNFTPLEEPKPAPETKFKDADGKELSLADFRGKVLLVNFWATWCSPCRKEMPGLNKLQTELGGDDFQVMAMSVDRVGEDRVKAFLKEIGTSALPLYFDRKMKLARGFRTRGLPVTVLIDREGREVGRLIGIAEWESKDAKALIRHVMDQPTQAAKGEANKSG